MKRIFGFLRPNASLFDVSTTSRAVKNLLLTSYVYGISVFVNIACEHNFVTSCFRCPNVG
jgi:hypothetical protein